jgi:hypothetical protein
MTTDRPLGKIHVAVLSLILFASGIYWTITALYLLPENPLREKFGSLLEPFGNIASQRWSFFAPPPQSNRKLYYTFFDASGIERASFETLEPILSAKRARAPFNTGEEILDYIISGAQEQLTKYVGRRQITQKKNGVTQSLLSVTIPEDINVPALRTLKSYTKYVAKNNHIPEGACYATITCTSISIPALASQDPVDKTERLVFRTTMFRIPGS